MVPCFSPPILRDRKRFCIANPSTRIGKIALPTLMNGDCG